MKFKIGDYIVFNYLNSALNGEKGTVYKRKYHAALQSNIYYIKWDKTELFNYEQFVCEDRIKLNSEYLIKELLGIKKGQKNEF